MSRMVSPNEMMQGAIDNMLDGAWPVSDTDWQKVINFIAHNLDPAVALPATLLFKAMYEIPLEDEEIKEIVRFQLDNKAGWKVQCQHCGANLQFGRIDDNNDDIVVDPRCPGCGHEVQME